jgi:UDP-glucose 4-epimerase
MKTTETVLISGVAGFIGAHVARRFCAEGCRVIGVDDLSGGDIGNVPGAVEFIECDLSSADAVSLLPRGCGTILHVAGQSSGEISFDNPVADLQKNTISTLNLIRYGLENRAVRVVYASSMSVYGAVPDAAVSESQSCAPLSCYGVGKLAAEGYLRVYSRQLPAVVLRMFNVYGPGQNMQNLRQGMVSIYLAQALANSQIEVKGSLERFRDFIYIDDVVEAWWRAVTYPEAAGLTLNVGTGVRTTVATLLQRICALVPGATYFVRGATPGDQNGIYADTRRLSEQLGFGRFTALDAGLSKFVEWARCTVPDGPHTVSGVAP